MVFGFVLRIGRCGKVVIEQGYPFYDEIAKVENVKLVGKLSGKNHPFVEDIKFIKKFESEEVVARRTISASTQFLAELTRGNNLENINKYYKKQEELVNDIQLLIKKLY